MVKNPPVNAGDTGSVPRLGRSPGEGNGNPLQYSHLGNPREESHYSLALDRDFGKCSNSVLLCALVSMTPLSFLLLQYCSPK